MPRILPLLMMSVLACQSAPAPVATDPAPKPTAPKAEETPPKDLPKEPAPMELTLGTPATLPNGATVLLVSGGHKHGKGFTTARFTVTITPKDGAPQPFDHSHTDGPWMFEALLTDFAVTIEREDARYVVTLTQPAEADPTEDARDERAQALAKRALQDKGCALGGFQAHWGSPGTYVLRTLDGTCSVTVGVYSGKVKP